MIVRRIAVFVVLLSVVCSSARSANYKIDNPADRIHNPADKIYNPASRINNPAANAAKEGAAANGKTDKQ